MAAVASAHMCAFEPLRECRRCPPAPSSSSSSSYVDAAAVPYPPRRQSLPLPPLLRPLPRAERGGVEGADKVAAGVCANLDGPCPSETNAGAPVQAYLSGDEIYMGVFKNADHFNTGAPGNFSAFLWDAAGNSKLLASARDTNAPSLSMYRLRGSLAGVAAGNYTVQTIYYTNNPQAPPAFFQCADVSVHPKRKGRASRHPQIRSR